MWTGPRSRSESSARDEHTTTMSSLVKPVHRVPENVSVAAVLDQFIKRREHLFVCEDDYGITSGIVTLEDAIETLLGVEIVDELDHVEDMRKYALEQWKRKRLERKNG